MVSRAGARVKDTKGPSPALAGAEPGNTETEHLNGKRNTAGPGVNIPAGVPVFPCKADKSPRTKRGHLDASQDPEQIAAWWKRWPDALVGVPTGKASGLLVVDIDPDGAGWYAENANRLACGRTHQTRRGHHLLYRTPAAEIRNSASKVAPGVDVRGEGGYIVWHPAHGLEAAGSMDDLTDPPAWLLEALQAPEQPKPDNTQETNRVNAGGRNDRLSKEAYRLRKQGLDPAQILDVLLALNDAVCDPPLDDAEVRQIVRGKARVEPEAKKPKAKPVSATELFGMEFGELHWNIDDILPAGTTLLFGKPKKGKSFLALMIAISIAAGRPVFGRRTHRSRVLYYGLEDSLRRLQRRTKGCATSLGVEPHEFAERLHLATESPRIDDGLLDELEAWMEQHPDTSMIVIDMLKKVTAASTGKNLYEEQSRVGDSLTKFCHEYPQLSLVVVHHSRKAESEDPFDLVSGTTGLSGSYDSLAAIVDADGLRILHMTGRDIEGAEIPLQMNDRGMYTLTMPTHEEKVKANMSDTRRKVFDAVPESVALRRKEIIKICGLTEADVDKQLRKLKHAGLVKSTPGGLYQKTGTPWFEDSVPTYDEF